MKTIHIIIILVVVIIVAVVITTFSGSDNYSNFTEAGKKPGKEVQIIGKLNMTKPIEYDARKNANQFSFYVIDKNGTEKKVICHKSKPQDFEKSDSVVMIGSMVNQEFVARNLFLKCPSKYNSKKMPEKFEKKTF